MIAKLVAHGRTRDEARQRLIAGLQDTVALGISTNQELLQRALSHEVFAEGEATTAFIADHADALLAPDAATQAQAPHCWLPCCCSSANAAGLLRWRTRCRMRCASRSTAWCTRRA
jgi:acetyl/propionyl-CoA carboxylase alpha subunit